MNLNINAIWGFLLYEAFLIPQLSEEPNGTQIMPPEPKGIILISVGSGLRYGHFVILEESHQKWATIEMRYKQARMCNKLRLRLRLLHIGLGLPAAIFGPSAHPVFYLQLSPLNLPSPKSYI